MKIRVKLREKVTDQVFREGDFVRVIQSTDEKGKIGRLKDCVKYGLQNYWEVEGLHHYYFEETQIVKI